MTPRSGTKAVSIAAVLLIACTVPACKRTVAQLVVPPATAPVATTDCLEPTSPDYYFAPGQITTQRDDSFMRRDWFNVYLRTADAESLSCGDSKEAYRVLWMPSSRNAKILTLALEQGFWRLDSVDFGKELFPRSWMNADTPHTVTRSTKLVSQSDLRRVALELESFDFWRSEQYRSHREVEDGYALVIEGRSGGNYRAVTRVNLWDGAEQIACPFFDIARVMLPDPIRCVRPVTVD